MLPARIPEAQRPLFAKMARRTVYIETPKTPGASSVFEGTGVLVSRQGLVLTAQHIVEGHASVKIRTCSLNATRGRLKKGRTFTADVIFEDPEADLAALLIREPLGRMPVATIGDSSLIKPGLSLYRVGWDDHQMVSGHLFKIAKTGRLGEKQKRMKVPVLSISMPCDDGASGAPVFDADLNLLAITVESSILKHAPTTSYAIPIHAVTKRLFWRKDVSPHIP
jgi:S1-C subfamily serine protease